MCVSALLALVFVQSIQQVLPPVSWRSVGQLHNPWQDKQRNQKKIKPEETRTQLDQNQNLYYLPQLQMVPVLRDKSQDLVQLKVLLLAADGEVVEHQVDQVHPPEGQALHILHPLVARGAEEEIEPEETQVLGWSSAAAGGGGEGQGSPVSKHHAVLQTLGAGLVEPLLAPEALQHLQIPPAQTQQLHRRHGDDVTRTAAPIGPLTLQGLRSSSKTAADWSGAGSPSPETSGRKSTPASWLTGL